MKRREFISSMAAAGIVLAASPRLFAASKTGGNLTVGLIGCGWFGNVNLGHFLKLGSIEVVALCDPNTEHLSKSLEIVAKHQSRVPQTYADYRALLSKPPEVVIVATPDHWHALPAIAAMQAGCDVFLEKPIGVDVLEGEALVAAARKYGSVVQVNTQRRSLEFTDTIKQRFLETGRLGKIGLVETYCYLGMGRGDVLSSSPAPEELDYEFWSGPAPKLPFKPGKEDGRWRRYQAYGNGIVGDMGVHMFDLARYLLDLDWPTRISSTGGILVETESDADISDTQRCVFEYPELRVTWEHRTWGVSPIKAEHWTDNWGVRIIGSKGTLNVTSLRYDFTPVGEGETESFHLCSPDGDPIHTDYGTYGEVMDALGRRHVQNFLEARLDRSPPVASIEAAHVSSSSCVLANLAQQLGRPVVYDPATRSIPGDPEATALLARPYRAPWVHPHGASV